MKQHDDDLSIHQERVYKSWKIMSYVVSHVEDKCFVAHLEPIAGGGYDCLSLITQDIEGNLRVRFMLNRNGVNANILQNVWERGDTDGFSSVAKELIELSELIPSNSPVDSPASTISNQVVTWIEEHRNENFCVGPFHWPGGCESYLSIQYEAVSEDVWPIPDHGPELCLGLDRVENLRLYQGARPQVSTPLSFGEKSDFKNEIEALAKSIACCTEINRACTDLKHPCHKVVTSQRDFGEEYRQVPEAWAGNMEHARVLFLSSNPSISTPRVPGTGEDYPLAGYLNPSHEHPNWPIERVIDFQVNRLDQARERPFVNNNAQFLCMDGQYRGSDSENGTRTSQNYWKSAIKQAKDLVGSEFDMGHDMCMTEIVHCKSKAEQGVSKASGMCSERYLGSILELSGSLLVLAGGAKVRTQVHAHRQKWQEDGLVVWDISETFGFFRKGENHPSDYVGLIQIQGHSKIVIATEQLSYASNTNRFVQSVIGEEALKKLADYLSSNSPIRFNSKKEVLDFLGY